MKLSSLVRTLACTTAVLGAAVFTNPALAQPGHDAPAGAEHAGAQAGGHEVPKAGVMPTVEQGIAPMVISLVVFGLVFAVLSAKVWPKISAGLKEREEKIRTAIEEAEMSRQQAKDALEQYQKSLENARAEDGAAMRYSHDPERLQDRYSTLPASTPAGMFALSLLGADLASDAWAPMRGFVLQRRPDGYRYEDDDAFVFRGTGNVYFWYYGTLAMFRAGGASWTTWNEGMKRTLVPSQAADGSWEPIDPYARYARDDARDKSYTTALCVLSLEVYYRYYLPLLKVK